MEETLVLPQLKEDVHKYLENFVSKNDHANNFIEVRQKAAESLNELAFPTTKHEEWRYTNLKSLLKTDFNFNVSEDFQGTNPSEIAALLPETSRKRLVFINGFLDESHSTALTSGGVEIVNINNASEKGTAIIKQHFSQYANVKEHPFVALSTAFYHDAVLLYFPKNEITEQPIEIYYVHDARNKSTISQPRILTVLETGAEVQLNDVHIVLGEKEVFVNQVNEGYVAANAKLTHSQLQDAPSNTTIINTGQIHQEKDSVYTNNVASTQGKLIRNNLNITLNGSNAEANMNGLYMLEGNTHVDNHTSVDHREPNTYSNELYKGIVDGKANAVFNGKIFVRQKAQKTNAFQSNNNILLSDTASVDTKPQLEIWADDVKCSHGATIGALDEEPLFYLQARGIPQTKARKLLLEAFLNEVTQKIADEALQEKISAMIESRFE